ncbi:hypothetical protein ABIF63_008682 [Bradyrhizobium japonicum]|uniref:Gluconolaconase n=1 Tax=Bradyrhizobium japonicum TaxID=375 RepID=A0ABV2S5X2_BRAJP
MASRLFATGIGAPEGPVCLPDGSMYVTEMSASTFASHGLTLAAIAG